MSKSLIDLFTNYGIVSSFAEVMTPKTILQIGQTRSTISRPFVLIAKNAVKNAAIQRQIARIHDAIVRNHWRMAHNYAYKAPIRNYVEFKSKTMLHLYPTFDENHVSLFRKTGSVKMLIFNGCPRYTEFRQMTPTNKAYAKRFTMYW